MHTKSLKKQNKELANAQRQLEILSNGIFGDKELPTFAKKLRKLVSFHYVQKNWKYFRLIWVICVTKFVSIVM